MGCQTANLAPNIGCFNPTKLGQTVKESEKINTLQRNFKEMYFVCMR